MLIELEKIIKFTPLEAYAKLLRIVHEVNGIVNMYKCEKYLSDVDSIIQSGTGGMGDEGIKFIKDDEEDTFQPQKGNVLHFVEGVVGSEFVLEPLWQAELCEDFLSWLVVSKLELSCVALYYESGVVILNECLLAYAKVLAVFFFGVRSYSKQ
ncbi:hypothetical protein Tco_1023405 [Tanacetum coccineum]